jgi:UDP-glucose 4-epimerase
VRRILVTGGAGFIGSHIVDKLVEESYAVRVIDNLSSGRLENPAQHRGNPQVEVMVGDLKRPEDAPLRPVSVYGASKAACENPIHAYSKLYGIRAVVLRYTNVVGPRLRHGVVWDFVNKLRRNPTELEILGDGKQIRSYVYIDDAVEATITAWRKTETSYEVYNIASEDWITVDEVADEVIKAMNLNNVKKTYKQMLHGVGWPGDVKKISLRIDKIKNF